MKTNSINKVSRGIRNNNPLNIRRSSSRWLGKIPFERSTDKEFEQFENMAYGLRAGAVLLSNYIKRGYNTIYKIVSRFAPASDGNDVSNYVSILKWNVHVTEHYVLDNSYIPKLLQAMCLVESNYAIDLSTINDMLISVNYKFKI